MPKPRKFFDRQKQYLTKHVLVRLQQRGKNSEAFKIIQRYGKFNPATKNITLHRKQALAEVARRKRWLARIPTQQRARRKQMQQRITNIERLAGCALVVSDDYRSIITIYDKTRRVYRSKPNRNHRRTR